MMGYLLAMGKKVTHCHCCMFFVKRTIMLPEHGDNPLGDCRESGMRCQTQSSCCIIRQALPEDKPQTYRMSHGSCQEYVTT